jgi:hypothetical protein
VAAIEPSFLKGDIPLRRAHFERVSITIASRGKRGISSRGLPPTLPCHREEFPGEKMRDERFQARDTCADDTCPDFHNRPVEARDNGMRKIDTAEIV